MKRAKLAFVLVLSLFSVMLSVQGVESAEAGPPLASGIEIMSPANVTYRPSLLTLRVRMTAIVARNIKVSMAYSLDGKENITIPIEIHGREMSFQATVTGSLTLSELSVGPHSLTVYAEHVLYNYTVNGVYHPKDVSCRHNVVIFTVDDGVSPDVSILSLENKTCNQEDFPLNFTTNEQTSWIGYCLDQKANATITGNTTLTGLAEGAHSIVVYANDTAGNMGVSEMVFFTVIQEKPPESFPTTIVAAASASSLAIAGMGLMVYFKKNKR